MVTQPPDGAGSMGRAGRTDRGAAARGRGPAGDIRIRDATPGRRVAPRARGRRRADGRACTPGGPGRGGCGSPLSGRPRATGGGGARGVPARTQGVLRPGVRGGRSCADPASRDRTPRRARRGRGDGSTGGRGASDGRAAAPRRGRRHGERRRRGRARGRFARTPGARGVDIIATDISPDALGLARENAVGHAVADRVRFAEADLLPDGEVAPFDVVLANLPYVRPRSSPRCRARRRSSRGSRSTAGPTGWLSSSGCSRSCRKHSRRTGSRCSRSGRTRVRPSGSWSPRGCRARSSSTAHVQPGSLALGERADIGDEDVETAQCLGRLGNPAAQCREIGDIDHAAGRPNPVARQHRDGFVERPLVARADRDVAAFGRQEARDGMTDAAGGR